MIRSGSLVWMTLFAIPAIVFRSSIPTKIGAVIFFITGVIEMVHWALVKGPITVVSLLTVGGTNFQESMDFMSLKSSYVLLLLFPYIVVFIYSLRRKRKYPHYKGKNGVVLIVALISIVFVSENAINGRLVRKGIPQFFKVYFSFSNQYLLYQQTELNVEPRAVEASAKNGDDQICVLIIGESLNRHHMSLYDYYRKTTPYLDDREDLFVFNDVVSPYSNTINSVLSLLSESNLDNTKRQEQSVDLFDVFSSAGFETFWLSNQPPYGIWENRITSIAKKSDNYTFVNLASNSSMEATLTASYDGKLFTPLIKMLESDFNKKLIIVHLMGNHTSYEKRYPNSFNRFQGNTTKDEVIAAYDNSVVYNDYVVDSMLNIIHKYSLLNNKRSSVIYLSDHGENVYDEANEVGHTYAGKLPKSNVDIPFIVWLSDDFKFTYPRKLMDIQNHTDKPYVSDDLFHSIIDLNQIETPFLIKSRSLFNAEYNENRKRILVDNQDYDK
jgi:heptose-I-phosphate ethanolaminephosphotransferase